MVRRLVLEVLRDSFSSDAELIVYSTQLPKPSYL